MVMRKTGQSAFEGAQKQQTKIDFLNALTTVLPRRADITDVALNVMKTAANDGAWEVRFAAPADVRPYSRAAAGAYKARLSSAKIAKTRPTAHGMCARPRSGLYFSLSKNNRNFVGRRSDGERCQDRRDGRIMGSPALRAEKRST